MIIYEKVFSISIFKSDFGYKKTISDKCYRITSLTLSFASRQVSVCFFCYCREIDFDNDHHLLFDKWIYITIDQSVSFSQICDFLEVSQVLRMDLKRMLRFHVQSLQSLPFLHQHPIHRVTQVDEEEDFTPGEIEGVPKRVAQLKTKLTSVSPLPSAEAIQMRVVEFLKIRIPCSIEDVSVNKVKALFV